MAQDQDLDLLGSVGSRAQHHPAQEPGDHHVDQPQRHRGIMPGFRRRRNNRSAGVSRVSGIHRVACNVDDPTHTVSDGNNAWLRASGIAHRKQREARRAWSAARGLVRPNSEWRSVCGDQTPS